MDRPQSIMHMQGIDATPYDQWAFTLNLPFSPAFRQVSGFGANTTAHERLSIGEAPNPPAT